MAVIMVMVIVDGGVEYVDFDCNPGYTYLWFASLFRREGGC